MDARPLKSCGNIFLDLGFDPSEAASLQKRAKIMSDLRLYLENNLLTYAEAADRLGISQKQILDLVHGRWERFSLDMLANLNKRLDPS